MIILYILLLIVVEKLKVIKAKKLEFVNNSQRSY